MHSDLRILLSKPFVPKLMCCLLLILIGWILVKGFLTFFSFDKPAKGFAQPLAVKQTESVQLKPVLEKPLFGEYVPDNLDDSTIKQSMLNLTVVGVIYAVNEEESQVLIRSANGQDTMFRVGDKLPGNVIVKRITPQGVLVERDGSLESLSLPKNELIFEPPAKPLTEE